MSLKSKISLVLGMLLMLVFLAVKSMVFIEYIPSSPATRLTEFFCFLLFIPLFISFVREFLKKNKEASDQGKYIKKLNSILIDQSHNPVFYEGNLADASRIITEQVVETIGNERTSIWLYCEEKESLICQQLHIKGNAAQEGIVLKKSDYESYFAYLAKEEVIAADDAFSHPATKCFAESYLKPLGINSMLDVPIKFGGEVIGVICIESFTPRKWKEEEINFAEMLSSLYSFSYSVNESNVVSGELKEIERFVDSATLVSKADKAGRITYVNQKFTDISGWTLDEALGKDHNVVNSGKHSSDFWKDMYMTTIGDRKIWNKIVTNKAKDGKLYYVDTYIKAEFESDGSLKGFTSIRQDVTSLKRVENEIRNRMNAINKSNAVIEFDLEGKIMYANSMFCEITEYEESEIVGCYHKMFVGEEFLFSNSRSKEYKDFWNKLKSGEFITGEFERTTKHGKKIWLQASYNPIIDESGNVYKIMKIATDITKRIEQSEEIEQKNTYLEHAAKILRHDMHSGINTYIPRGISSLERRLTEEDIKRLKIEAPLKMIKEGLKHTQKVYKGVYEFTNLVKKDIVLSKSEFDIKAILGDYLGSTSYKSQVMLDDSLPTLEVNESLFCTSIDNLIRNGLKYNDSDTKMVKIYFEEDSIYVVDNGRGMTQEDFTYLSKPYVRKKDQKESGTGLGLNICIAILKEHGFSITAEKLAEGGTKLKIKIR